MDPRLVHEIGQELAAHAGDRAARRRIKERAMRDLGISLATLNRRLAAAGYGSGRSRRSDAGKRRVPIPEETFDAVLAIQSRSPLKGKMRMAAWVAIKQAIANGVPHAERVTPGTYNRWMRARRIRRDAIETQTPYRPLASRHPNHVHEIDASVCVQWYLKPAGDIGHQSRVKEVYKNKDGRIATRKLIRYLCVDHTSGAFAVRYYHTGGETAEDLIDFLRYAWGPKADPRYTFRGVPQILYMDQGPGNKARITQHLLRALDVRWIGHAPGNARATGAVEGAQGWWETYFETRLREQPAASVEQLNAWAEAEALYYNHDRIHSRHHMTRLAAWNTIPPDALRELPTSAVLDRIIASPTTTRTVQPDCTIQFDGRRYRLPVTDYVGEQIDVAYNAYAYPAIDAHVDGTIYRLDPIELSAYGFESGAPIIGETYAAQATPAATRRRQELDAAPLPTADGAPFRAFGFTPERPADPAPPAPGRAIPIDPALAQPRAIPIGAALRRIRQTLGRGLTAAENAHLRGRYPEAMDEDALADETARLLAADGVRGPVARIALQEARHG